MKVTVKPGKYVLAVSGGMDSMVLLDLLSRQSGLDVVVAHFDHGIRSDSEEDRRLVEAAAARYGLPFVTARGELGANASEAAARQARYAFLRQVMADYHADAIITAHHQDDRLETAIINMIRGTGRKGLDALTSRPGVLRPLLHVTKNDLYEYARRQKQRGRPVLWREDSTNASDAYLRNYIRHHVTGKLNSTQRRAFIARVARAHELNAEIDELLLAETRGTASGGLNRYRFIMLPYAVSCEVMAAWLRQHNVRQFDRRTIGRLVIAAKVAFPGKTLHINTGYLLEVGRRELHITPDVPS